MQYIWDVRYEPCFRTSGFFLACSWTCFLVASSWLAIHLTGTVKGWGEWAIERLGTLRQLDLLPGAHSQTLSVLYHDTRPDHMWLLITNFMTVCVFTNFAKVAYHVIARSVKERRSFLSL